MTRLGEEHIVECWLVELQVLDLDAAGVAWLVPVTTDDEGEPTEQTKAKIADPSGNVIEFKTYRDVDAALEISTYSYPEAFAHGN